MAVVAETGTSLGATSRPKRLPMLKEKHSPPLIILLGYTWVDTEVGTYFSQYNHESDLINLLSWLPIRTKMDLDHPPHCWVRCHSARGVCVHKSRGDEHGFLLHV